MGDQPRRRRARGVPAGGPPQRAAARPSGGAVRRSGNAAVTAATVKVTARDVRAALYQHFMPRWAMLNEVTAPDPETGRRSDRGSRIDALLVRRRPRRDELE